MSIGKFETSLTEERKPMEDMGIEEEETGTGHWHWYLDARPGSP